MRPRDLGLGKLYERTRDAAIVADAKTQRIVLWNHAATNIFGYSTLEALGMRVEDLVPEPLKDQHRVGISRYAETGPGPYIDSPRLLELPAQRKGGEEIYIELSLSPIGLVKEADSSERYVLAIVRDITKRKRVEEDTRRLNQDLENRVAERTKQLEERERKLRESEERYRSFIEQSTEGIWLLEFEEPVPTDLRPDEQVERFYRHGYLAECNDAMARMYGYTRAEEIVGARIGDLFPPSIRQNVEYLKAFVRSGYRLTDTEFEEVDRHGDTKQFLSNLTGIVEDESLVRVWVSQRDITESKQAEEALKQSELLYHTLIEQSPLSIQILSPDGRTLEVNRAWEELWGVTLEDIAGYNLLEDQQLVTKGIMPYVQRGFAGEPTPIPPIMYDPNETIPGLTSRQEPERWVSAFIYPVRDEAGNVREVILMHDDITEHKQAEEVRARLAAIVESSDDAIIGKTLEAIITNWNRGAQKIYGYSAEEVVGKPINILVPPERPDEIPKIMERLRRGEVINHYETVRVTKDGRRLDISLTISPIRDSSGDIVGASTSARDITERKRAEEALKQSELLYHTVIEQATENIFLVDIETRRIMESNPTFQRTLGYTEEELRTMTLYDIVAAERKSIDRNIRRVQGKDPFVGERKYRRKDGSLVDVEVSASVILRNGRETLCVVAHDVTERKRMEEAQRFLSEAGATLSSSLDYRTTLASVARLAVPRLADWCAVDIVEEEGSLERLAVEHEDPQKVQLAHELQERYPPDPEAPQGVAQVVRSGQAQFSPDITDEMLVASARDAEHLRLMREIGFVSVIFVPLVARGRTLGAITLVSAESGRHYGQAALELAEELARRAALAVDNARLYEEAQREISEREAVQQELRSS